MEVSCSIDSRMDARFLQEQLSQHLRSPITSIHPSTTIRAPLMAFRLYNSERVRLHHVQSGLDAPDEIKYRLTSTDAGWLDYGGGRHACIGDNIQRWKGFDQRPIVCAPSRSGKVLFTIFRMFVENAQLAHMYSRPVPHVACIPAQNDRYSKAAGIH
ncbi:hypothetical protein E1B28_012665 [Marasmius oreades]|uniref:Uncharacterized protein n=1 Tax=Marasmius oreades TaxID=181124 RepID=A0A9P7RS48_9AGAR|nr:uncharacterized protein E1B28_012665 [Marasmius oreades]KAG7088695.1 hypothetical protein E1B28_012665 [Marasmius oreades]